MTNPSSCGNDPSDATPGASRSSGGGYTNSPPDLPVVPMVSCSYSTTATMHASTALAAMRVIEGHPPVKGLEVAVSENVRLAEIQAAREGQKLAHDRYLGDLSAMKDDANGERRIDTGILIAGATFLLVGFVYYMFSKDMTGITVGVSSGLVAFAYRAGRGKLQPSGK